MNRATVLPPVHLATPAELAGLPRARGVRFTLEQLREQARKGAPAPETGPRPQTPEPPR